MNVANSVDSSEPGDRAEPGANAGAGATVGAIVGRFSRPALPWTLAAVITMAAAVLPAVSRPGEISWLIDEPQLIARAYHANQSGRLAERGLVGNFGVSYGPTATQVYQLLLAVTHDPIVLARLRAGLCAGITALGLLWLARSLQLNPWFAAAVVVAPYLWVFQRILWDASFAIPVGTIALAAYAAFLRHGRLIMLLLALFCTLLLPFIHPQNLPLAAPILLHMAWRRRTLLRLVDVTPLVVGAMLVVLAVVGLNFKYFFHLWAEVSYYMAVGFPKTYPGYHSWAAAYFGPIGLDVAGDWVLARLGMPQPPPTLPGRHILGGHGFMGSGDGGFGKLVLVGKYGLYIFYPLLWGGMVIAAWRLVRGRRSMEDGAGISLNPSLDGVPGRPAGLLAVDIKRALGGIALAGVLFQMLLAGRARVPAEPQYFFGTVVLHALLAWLAVDALARVRLSHVAAGAYGLSGAAVTLGILWHYHSPASPPAVPNPATDHPTLGDSVAVVEALRDYPADMPAVTDIDLYQRFPQTLRSLRLLVPPTAPTTGTPRRGEPMVLIRFRRESEPGMPKVEVVGAFTRADIPSGARRINVAPLPEGWYSGEE